MKTRRDVLWSVTAAGAAAAVGVAAKAAPSRYAPAAETAVTTPIAPPEGRPLRVAFVLGAGMANVIDTAGPWEVFQDTTINGSDTACELYTVAAGSDVVEMTGGMLVKPNYSVADAPQPDVIVVPAHMGTEASQAWLREAGAGAGLIMSVCTGAFMLAEAGLLDGLPAATHHDYWDAFERRHPNVELIRGLRFVDNGRIASAGGLTSGIDLALHVVRRHFGRDVALATATYMEHQSDTWLV